MRPFVSCRNKNLIVMVLPINWLPHYSGIADAERHAAELAVAVEASRMACKRILEVSMPNASAHLRAESRGSRRT